MNDWRDPAVWTLPLMLAATAALVVLIAWACGQL